MHNKNVVQILIGVILIILIPIWIIFAAPILKKIPNNFTYTADILSLDNFYDPALKKYEGEHISKNSFNYKIINANKNSLVIQNEFAVRTLSGNLIFAVKRDYVIDPYTGQHIQNADSTREGYLFAPRYVGNKNFVYWHVNYNAPAQMHFIGKEKIHGLSVNVFESNYEADQTENLNYLKNVPSKYGIKTLINLKLWIEPVSGWLVKYEDHSVAYFYDISTGKILEPWNKFSNRFTQTSINKQVEIARLLKLKILLIDLGLPILFIFIAILLFVNVYRLSYTNANLTNPFREIKIENTLLLYFLVFLFVMSSVIYLFIMNLHRTYFIVGISTWNNSSDYMETVKGFKDGLSASGFKEGKNITYIIKNPNENIERQITIMQEFVNKKVDLIFTLTTTGTIIAKGMTSVIPIVFSEVSYPAEIGIIESTRASNNNLVGTRNYISAGDAFYRFEKLYPQTKRIGFLYHKSDPDSEIQFKEYKEILSDRGIIVEPLPAVDVDHVKQLLEKNQTDAIFIACDNLLREARETILSYLHEKKVPNFTCDKITVTKGALIGYIADHYKIGQMAGEKAALILQGAEPTWLGTDILRKGFLIINLPAANELGIKIPPDLEKEANQLVKKDV